jgi:N-acetylglucosaminyldiphosphoundecaprenol N-acetyl-beta-D-mannosaminyltransferase
VSSFDFTQTQRLAILGVEIDCVDFALTLDLIDAWVMQRRAASDAPPACRQICTVNPEFIVDARRDPAFARVLADADLCVPDGAGVLWAARRMGQPLHERVTGSDGIYRICARGGSAWLARLLARRGARRGRAGCRRASCDRYPGLDRRWCVRRQPGRMPSGRTLPPAWQCRRSRHPLRRLRPPAPGFLARRSTARVTAAVAIGVGGAFDFVAGVRSARQSGCSGAIWSGSTACSREPWRWRRMLKVAVSPA